MQVQADRLRTQIEGGALAGCYFLYGDEPLQLTELGDTLRAKALAEGYTERRVFDADVQADWDAIEGEGNALSLFAEKRLIEIRIGSRKPDKRGTAVLERLVGQSPSDDLYLVTAGALDYRAQKARWFKILEKGAVSCGTRTLPPQQLPGWLRQRAKLRGKQLSDEAARLVAERVEGNLLAAAQEVEKLCLIVADETISADAVVRAVSDSARFDVFQLCDAVLAGQLERALRILRGLVEEGMEPPLITWALGRELRKLATMANKVARGTGVQQVMDEYRVWRNRQTMTRHMLTQFDARTWNALLAYLNRIDMGAKGGLRGAPWDELEILIMRLCGRSSATAMMAKH